MPQRDFDIIVKMSTPKRACPRLVPDTIPVKYVGVCKTTGKIYGIAYWEGQWQQCLKKLVDAEQRELAKKGLGVYAENT